MKKKEIVMVCNYCQKESKTYFCDYHLDILDNSLKYYLSVSKKEESIARNINKSISFLKENEIKNGKNSIYFAHPMKYYKTKNEDKNLTKIKDTFSKMEIINPSKISSSSMKYYENIVKQCGLVVAQPFDDLYWGAGVFAEISVALDRNIPVKMIFNDEISDFNGFNNKILSIYETFLRNKK